MIQFLLSLILNIETSSKVCSVTLSKDGQSIGIAEDFEQNHAATLAIMIKQVMDKASIGFSWLDAVALSAGPGSYTGLRIGAATAKGLCYALNKPLIALDSLQLLAIRAASVLSLPFLYCPVIDARRNDLYYGLYTASGIVVKESEAITVTESFLGTHLRDNKIVMIGSGISKCRDALPLKNNILFDETIRASASAMCSISHEYYELSKFTDVISFEPYYLKPAFVKTIIKKEE